MLPDIHSRVDRLTFPFISMVIINFKTYFWGISLLIGDNITFTNHPDHQACQISTGLPDISSKVGKFTFSFISMVIIELKTYFWDISLLI